jgi:murein DD-endopeptidase MepM/ murein hydrolase activator NlpD
MNMARSMRPSTLLLVSAVAALTLMVATCVFAPPGLIPIGGDEQGEGRGDQAQSLEGMPFTVLPGWSAEQIAHGLEQLGLADSEAFLAAVRSRAVALATIGEPPRHGSLEGYLLPDTYRILPGMTPESIVAMMARNFQRSFLDSLSWKARKRGLDRDTLVSISAAMGMEAAPSERRLYAGVLLGRLRSGLPVGVQATGGELQVRHDGGTSGVALPEGEPLLPPPLGSPSLAEMNAVLDASETDYLYAVRKPDGSHAFAETPEGYATLKERYASSERWVRSLPPVQPILDVELQNLLEHSVGAGPAYSAVVVKDLTTGQFAEVHEHDQFTAAGLWKLLLLVAAFQAHDAGHLHFDELLPGGVGTVQDALEAIAKESDDEAELAALALYERLGSGRVQAAVEQLGLVDTVVSAGARTRTSARDMAWMLEKLVNGDLIGTDSSDELRRLLLLGGRTLALGSYVPDTIPVAGKRSRANNVAHEVGIVYTGGTAYVVAILTRVPASDAIPCLSNMIYSYLTHGIGNERPSGSQSDARLTGFVFPIPGAWLPSREDYLPNAPRTYRRGIHEGIDFYDGDACVPVRSGTPLVAAKEGLVIRADRNFVEMTPAELGEVQQRVERQGYTDPESLDRFRGRQIWIDHGDGVVTVYAHLLEIAEGIDVGVNVKAGQLIAHVGNSGTPEGVFDPEANSHLHFEIRVDGDYLGKGLPISEVRATLLQAFAVPPR